MEITFDPEKDARNVAKHGISLALAAKIDWSTLDASLDDRHEYGEERYVAGAPIGDRLYVVVFVVRDDAIRVISLRKANKREVKHYGEQT